MTIMHSTVMDQSGKVIGTRVDENISLGASYALTTVAVDSNTIAVTGRSHVISSATTEAIVNTISGAVLGQRITFFADSGINVRFTETDNIEIESNAATSMYIRDNQHFTVIYNGSVYVEIGTAGTTA